MKKEHLILSLFFFLATTVNSFAQPGKARISTANKLEKGEALYAQGAYIQAVTAFSAAVEHNPNDAVTRWKLAETYLKINDYKRAAQQFKIFYESEDKDIQLNYPNAGFYYAVALRQLGNNETAKGVLTRYIDKNKTNTDLASALLLARAKTERDGCDFAMSDYSNMKAEIVNIGTVTNGIYNEASATFSDDKTMYYTAVATNTPVSINESRRTFSKLYRATNDGTVWINQTALPEVINTAGVHNSNACVTSDGKRMYFTRCAEQTDGKMQCYIYLSQIGADGSFGAPLKLEEEINATNSSTSTPFVMDAGRGDDLLYFASNRKGTKGGYDIWSVIRHPEGTYDNLQNITDINTPVDEVAPFVDKEGLVYFSSNGHAGYGGFDIFSYQVIEQEPVIKNLGKPVNSAADDLYFTTNSTGTYGFLVSNRVGSKGFDENNPTSSDDIFTVKIDRKKPLKDKTTPKAPVENVVIGKEVRKDIIVDGNPKVIDSKPKEEIKQEPKIAENTATAEQSGAEKKRLAEEAAKVRMLAAINGTDKVDKTNEKVDKTNPAQKQNEIGKSEKPVEIPKTEKAPVLVAGTNYKNPKRNVSADACARACLYDITSGTAYSVRDVPCANENNIDFALYPNKKYIFVLERAGEVLQSREISTLSSKKSEIFHPRLENREVTIAPPTLNASVQTTKAEPAVNNQPKTDPEKPFAIEPFSLKGGLASDNTTAKATDLTGTTVILYRMDNETSVTEIARKQTTADNVFEFTVKQGMPYRLVAEKTGFLKASIDFTADKNNTKPTEQLVLREKKANVAFKMNNIYYETNSAMLTPESIQELNGLLTLMNDNLSSIIEISAHTDNSGTSSVNQALSQRRAQSVVDYLTSHGISANRLRAKGYGATQPISDNKTEASRAKNRRTEFKLVGEIK